KDLNLEPVVARLGDRLGEGFRRPIDGIERFWITRCQPPLELRHGLRDGGLGDCGRRGGQAGCPQELTTFHESSLASSAIGAARAKHVRSSSLKLETLALIADRQATRPLASAKGGAREARRRRSQGRLSLRPRSGADHEAVVGVFRDLPPQNLVV